MRQYPRPLSQYANLCGVVVPQDHVLRKWKELVNFGCIIDELEDKYCLDNRRPGDCLQMFKYLLL